MLDDIITTLSAPLESACTMGAVLAELLMLRQQLALASLRAGCGVPARHAPPDGGSGGRAWTQFAADQVIASTCGAGVASGAAGDTSMAGGSRSQLRSPVATVTRVARRARVWRMLGYPLFWRWVVCAFGAAAAELSSFGGSYSPLTFLFG